MGLLGIGKKRDQRTNQPRHNCKRRNPSHAKACWESTVTNQDPSEVNGEWPASRECSTPLHSTPLSAIVEGGTEREAR
jgi:hypothetical protein